MPSPGTDPVLLRRIERLIGLLAPMLDLLVAVGDRVSRVLEPDDPYYAPPRMRRAGESAPRGLTFEAGGAGRLSEPEAERLSQNAGLEAPRR